MDFFLDQTNDNGVYTFSLLSNIIAISHSPVAQSAEQMAVNHLVRGSSPCWGAKINPLT